MAGDPPAPGHADLVVVANRLAVDRVVEEDGTASWRRSPGGLVTALAPIMTRQEGAWVGWGGSPEEELDEPLEPFTHEGMHLVPVPLTEQELVKYYEGFSNSTLWPLYHDVIARPEFHRQWWDTYQQVNARFAHAAAATAAEGATVWVQDYQLQLVPRILRRLRPDLRIGYFHHIPFPPVEIYAQLPWRRPVLEGLLGADLIGFQRRSDVSNFQGAVRRILGSSFRSNAVQVKEHDGGARTVGAAAFPISIDVDTITDLAQDPDIQARARQIREELGNPRTILLGVDRLDYTKGIRHRIKAFSELLEDGRLSVEDACLVQVASPSRESVDSYKELRDEIELSVGRVNGTFDTMGHTAIRYLHHSYPVEEMVALYLAADVMLVTALRDGMNLVAKEYVAARGGWGGVLVLSEFAGAADQLRKALLVNPHDIDGLKNAIMEATEMAPGEATKRMKAMHRQLITHDVNKWSRDFLDRLGGAAPAERAGAEDGGQQSAFMDTDDDRERRDHEVDEPFDESGPADGSTPGDGR
ncbi:alpha,alpha-trehalose-phosphate synthase (UDP-forming) [Citricoccus zhacaiensis]|uniref:alpha,alpha-trehalose-phosphate synthase (UDP-forming) n=1 Tax=Citricoccus zhacaiensis TaxID=489142 RepID=UPI001E4A09C6|nr:trehalose-6-phosphate synthase [Citricoccus zhacaiensis]